MKVVLAYSGGLADSVAVAWLAEEHRADVVTLTLDLGQSGNADEIRARALACGAVRAHVIDAREPFARTCILPAVGRTGSAHLDVGRLAHPLIARTLVEVAAIEGAAAVAHASGGAGLDAAIADVDPAVRVLAPARLWAMDAEALQAYALSRGLPAARGTMSEWHLLTRPSVDPALAPDVRARVAISFDENGVPTAVNDVPMGLTELIESLSLIAGQHGIGHADPVRTPAAVVLRAAYASASEPAATVRLTLHKGTLAVVPSGREVDLVTHS